jgi:GAF domain-containing protein
MSFESTFVAQISEARTPDAVWKALEEFAGAVAGHGLFTVMTTDVAAGVVRRAYSNRPSEYPTSGTKPLRGNTGEWFETVFNQRRTFVANTIEDIAKVFPDHELIGSLGLGSVVNYPVVLEGDLVAAINLLDAVGHYTPDRVRAIEELLAVPARLCAALTLLLETKSEVTA